MNLTAKDANRAKARPVESSSRVTMGLDVGLGRAAAVRQMGPDFVLLADPAYSEPTQATLSLRVDDSETLWPVWLPEGIQGARVKIAAPNLT